MSTDTQAFGIAVVRAIEDRFFEEGTLNEQRFHAHAPTGHYAVTCAATASMRAFDVTGDEGLYDVGEQLLSCYLSLSDDERGHNEFNSFALLELLADARERRYELPVSQRTLAGLIGYSSSPTTREGNNWLLLQALCRAKYADLFDDEDEHQHAADLLEFAEWWRLNDGIVADEPRYLRAHHQTPLTYHSKMSMVACRFARLLPDARLADEAEEHLQALARLCMPNGEALYYGRSENTIFGYANAIDAFAHLIANRNHAPDWSVETASRLLEFLFTRFDPGRLNCQPREFSADDQRLDGYIYDLVYASYAAMLLLGLPEMSRESGGEPRRTRPTRSYSHLPDAGLLAVRNGETALGISVDGQVRFRRSGPDSRYAGLVPHAFVHGEESVYPGVPLTVDDSPWVPFLPVIHHEGNRYAPVRWESSVLERDSGLTARGDGRYYEFSSPGTGETDGDGSPVRRLKNLVKRYETTRRMARRGFRAAKRALEVSRLDLVYEKRTAEPVELPARTRRSLHYLSNSGAVIVQTATLTGRKTTISPTSAVIAKQYDHALDVTYDGDVRLGKTPIRTHKTKGYWYAPDADSTTDAFDGDATPTTWSVLVIDPDGRIERTESFVEERTLITTVGEGSDQTVRTPLPYE